MNFDTPKLAAEREPRFPSLEEITAKLRELCGHENPAVVRTIEDEKGVVTLHEVVITDEAGDDTLYIYRRAGDKAATTDITTNCFMGKLEENMCVGGENLSTYDETSGQWIDTGVARGVEATVAPVPVEMIPTQSPPTDPVIVDKTNAQEVFSVLLKKEAYTALQKQFDEIEVLYTAASSEETDFEKVKEIRGKAKPLLDQACTRLIVLNKIESQNKDNISWNPAGDLTREQFYELNLRRMKLSNAVGMLHKGASGKIVIRHNLNEI